MHVTTFYILKTLFKTKLLNFNHCTPLDSLAHEMRIKINLMFFVIPIS
jgi:hypothetical protein